jgi:hypothetical protein
MNYIELINNFWKVDMEARFSSVDVHLYFYLLSVCNTLAWRNPFSHSNSQLTGALGISEKTLIASKKRLQEAGLIEYEGGDSRRKSSIYFLKSNANYCNKVSSSVSSLVSGLDSRAGKNGSALNKQEKTKLNNSINDRETIVSQHAPEELNISDFKEELLDEGINTPTSEKVPLNGKFDKNNSKEKKKGSAEKRKESAAFIKPTLEEVVEYCKERGNGIDPQQWIDHYTSNGWKVGKNSMKDWKAAVRTWEKNGINNNSNNYGRKEQTGTATGRPAKVPNGSTSKEGFSSTI